MIPYGRQEITQEDIDSVLEVLKSDFLTQRLKVPEFERAIATQVDVKHSFAMNSATSALHVACMALGLSEGDWLWTSPLTFVASANVGLYCGAKGRLCGGVDPTTHNMCPQKLEKLEIASVENKLPKVLIPVHLAGQPCDMAKIECSRYNVKIIEDASHAIGGSYRGGAVGNCEFSDISVFSFHPVKIITTGEGGCAVTNDDDLAERMRLHRSHGITRDQKLMTEEAHGEWYYEQIALGYNYRMTDIQAALGLTQLSRLEEFVARRHAIAARYDERMKGLPVKTPFQLEDAYSGFHLYIIRLSLGELDLTHRQILMNFGRTELVSISITFPFILNLTIEKGFRWN